MGAPPGTYPSSYDPKKTIQFCFLKALHVDPYWSGVVKTVYQWVNNLNNLFICLAKTSITLHYQFLQSLWAGSQPIDFIHLFHSILVQEPNIDFENGSLNTT